MYTTTYPCKRTGYPGISAQGILRFQSSQKARINSVTFLKIVRIFILRLFYCIAFSGCATGQSVDPADALPIRHPVLTAEQVNGGETNFYGVYFASNKVGWAVFTRGRGEMDGDGRDCVLGELEMRLAFESDGKPLTLEVEMWEAFSLLGPYPFLAGSSVVEANGNRSAVRLERRGKRFERREEKNGRLKEDVLPANDYSLSDYLSADLEFTEPRAVGHRFRTRALDLRSGTLGDEIHEVKSVRKTRVLGAPVTWYEVESGLPEDAAAALYTVDNTGRLVELGLMDLLALRLEPEAVAREPSAPFHFKQGVVKASEALGDVNEIERLTVSLAGDYQGLIEPGVIQTVTYDPAANRTRVTVGPQRKDLPPVDRKTRMRAVAESGRYPTKHPEVVAMRDEAIRGTATARARVEALVHHVHRVLRYEADFEDRDVLRVIRERRGDCSEAALLFVTLARASGLPTREVGGLVYADDRARRFEVHAWAEVLLNGQWHPVDPTWDEVEVNRTHIQFESSLHDGADPLVGGVTLLKLLSKEKATTLRVERVERKK